MLEKSTFFQFKMFPTSGHPAKNSPTSLASQLRKKISKTPLGKIFLFLVFVSTTSLYMVFYKMTKIRDYYEDGFQKSVPTL